MKKSFSIAIDGPVGVGKGTLAIALAKRFNATYIYTGGMYRALALACLKADIDLNNEDKILEVLGKSAIELKVSEYGTRVFLNGEEVSDEIFLPKVSSATPIVAALADVRREMVKRQKMMIEKGDRAVIDGRDISTDVMPNADLKIFLTADLKIRVQRRYRQLIKRGVKTTLEEVLLETIKRDKMDTERKTSPLVISKDAYVLDTTSLTIGQTIDRVMEKLKEKGIA